MNLLMILIIIAAVWVCAAICYFAWQLIPDEKPPEPSDSTAVKSQEPTSKDASD